MKLNHRLLGLFFLVLFSLPVFSQSTVWSLPDKTPPADPRAKFRDMPPLMIDTNTWRLMVEIGTNVAFSGTVNTETNVSLANITAANPLPVFMPTNSMAVNTQTNVGGFTYIGTAAVDVDTTATGVAANEVLAPGVTIANATRSSGGTALLQTLTWIHGGTLADPNVKPEVNILVCSDVITWPTTNATANLVQTQLTNVLGEVQFTSGDFRQFGTNWIGSKTGIGIGLKPLTTSVYLYPVNKTATTNSNPSRIKWTILQD